MERAASTAAERLRIDTQRGTVIDQRRPQPLRRPRPRALGSGRSRPAPPRPPPRWTNVDADLVHHLLVAAPPGRLYPPQMDGDLTAAGMTSPSRSATRP